MKKNSLKEIVLVSSMFFGMLFGAGNLIFPVSMGQRAGVEVFVATLGFCITGVGLPLLSVLALSSSNSASVTDMAKLVGKKFSIFFTTALYLCIGPLFAIPRTATVPFQVGVVPFLPEDTKQGMLFLFSFLFFVFALVLSLKPGKLLTYVGKVLNPLFLLFLGILLFVAVLFPIGGLRSLNPVLGYEKGSFLKGIFEGYNTMDVMGALAFGNVLIQTIRSMQGNEERTGEESAGEEAEKRFRFVTVLSGSLAALLMVLLYFALSYAGAESRLVFSVQENGGDTLHSLSTFYFHRFGGILLAVIIYFSCLKTAVGLISSAAMAFQEMFPERFSYRIYVFLFTICSFVISNIGLSRIIQYAVPVLFFIYPICIVLIILCLFGKAFSYDRAVFQSAIYCTIPFAFLDALKVLLEGALSRLPGAAAVLSFFSPFPFFSMGLTWLLPSLLGFAFGMLLWYTRKVQREKENR
nr:branched-chain amino acid transport system II carrier protein [uncultured Oribacterium sp.]